MQDTVLHVKKVQELLRFATLREEVTAGILSKIIYVGS